ncbi:hypothetical protein chiPu_0029190, partial [Chiloscyllium punctatum]|nr:hypothetical protein [Chiloscyllium punctatum]
KRPSVKPPLPQAPEGRRASVPLPQAPLVDTGGE